MLSIFNEIFHETTVCRKFPNANAFCFCMMYNLVEVNKKITQILTANLKQSLPFVC